MPRPRGARAIAFSQSSRAVVREAEWIFMANISTELKPLVHLANSQGWKVEPASGGSKLKWTGPNNEGPIFTSYRPKGRDLHNSRSALVRAGLRLDEQQAKVHTENESVAVAADKYEDGQSYDIDALKENLDAAMAQIAVIVVKAEAFDQVRSDAKEWEEVAQTASEEAAMAKQENAFLHARIAAITDCFKLAPWAILPEIAKILGVDSHQPGTTSTAEAAIADRRI